jgi:hypothetical protein
MSARTKRGKYRVYVGWGECPFGEAETVLYEFDSKAELDAFLWGVEQSNGWNSYECFDEPHVYDCNEWTPIKAKAA